MAIKQVNRNYVDEIDNNQVIQSKLIINSITQFDYADYYCKANNMIGEGVQKITLKRKRNYGKFY